MENVSDILQNSVAGESYYVYVWDGSTRERMANPIFGPNPKVVNTDRFIFLAQGLSEPVLKE